MVTELSQVESKKLTKFTKKIPIWDFARIFQSDFAALTKVQKGYLTHHYYNCMTTKIANYLSFSLIVTLDSSESVSKSKIFLFVEDSALVLVSYSK